MFSKLKEFFIIMTHDNTAELKAVQEVNRQWWKEEEAKRLQFRATISLLEECTNN